MTSTPARSALRLLVAGAVLAGLFAMHGLPAGSGPGCHAAVPAAEAMSMPQRTPPQRLAPGPAGPRFAPLPSAGAAGSCTMCVSTAARRGGGPAAPGLLTVGQLAVVLLATSWSGPSGRERRSRARRGPPLAGVALLTRVCVSRT